MPEKALTVFGEVLFDHFPDGSRVLGGAPFNVAWHLHAFGGSPRMVSRVGNDAEGAEVRAAMTAWGMASNDLQTDSLRPTGRVDVTFSDNEPTYRIVEDCAYDHIEPVVSKEATLLYHGTLAARAPGSAGSLGKLRTAGAHIVFIDVNLRDPWWQKDEVEQLIQGAHWVKLNDNELTILGGGAATETAAPDFLHRFQLQALLVTHGSRGAELFTRDGEKIAVAPVSSTQVIDTVGAGDAFTSVILLGLLRDWPLPLALQRAQEFAAAVVGQRGATVSQPNFYQTFLQRWQPGA